MSDDLEAQPGNTRRVFVFGSSAHDFSAAERYGRLVTLLEGRPNPFQLDELIQDVVHELDKHKATKQDYYLLSGNSTVCAVVSAVLQVKFGTWVTLIFGAKQRDYTARDVDVARFITGG